MRALRRAVKSGWFGSQGHSKWYHLIEYIAYDFALVFRRNYVSVLYYFRYSDIFVEIINDTYPACI